MLHLKSEKSFISLIVVLDGELTAAALRAGDSKPENTQSCFSTISLRQHLNLQTSLPGASLSLPDDSTVRVGSHPAAITVDELNTAAGSHTTRGERAGVQ